MKWLTMRETALSVWTIVLAEFGTPQGWAEAEVSLRDALETGLITADDYDCLTSHAALFGQFLTIKA